MNHHGVVVDLAHAGQRTALEAAQQSSRPVIVSHANPRTLYPSVRNLLDEVIDAVAAGGGVIGASPFALLNWDGKATEVPRLEAFLRAVDYLVERVGIDHVGIGTDSEATEGAYPAEVTAELKRRYGQMSSAYNDAIGKTNTKHVIPFRGMRDLPMLTGALLDHGYSAEDVQKIMGLNFVRVYKEVWPT
jgi:membrane dipeptidase